MTRKIYRALPDIPGSTLCLQCGHTVRNFFISAHKAEHVRRGETYALARIHNDDIVYDTNEAPRREQ